MEQELSIINAFESLLVNVSTDYETITSCKLVKDFVTQRKNFELDQESGGNSDVLFDKDADQK